MAQKLKVHVKPPKTIFVAHIIILPLFMIFGLVLFSVADKEVMPFIAIFFLIWEAGCIALLVNAIKALKLIRSGKTEVAEISGLAVEKENDFVAKLRGLDALKKDGLISDDEYRKKRAEIMEAKW